MTRWPPITGATVAAITFSAINFRDILRQSHCADCLAPRGIPFVLYRESGFAGGAGLVWSGVIADIAIGILAAALAAWLFDQIWRAFRQRLVSRRRMLT